MTSLPKFSVPGVPLDFVDVGDPGLTAKQARAALDALASVHMRHFDDYPHMLDEFERWRAHGWPDPDVDPHIWMAMREEQPVGEFVVHTNTRHCRACPCSTSSPWICRCAGVSRGGGWQE